LKEPPKNTPPHQALLLTKPEPSSIPSSMEGSAKSPKSSNKASAEKMRPRLPSDWRLLPDYMQERERLNEELAQEFLERSRKLGISAI
jgi:hypothetical protein